MIWFSCFIDPSASYSLVCCVFFVCPLEDLSSLESSVISLAEGESRQKWNFHDVDEELEEMHTSTPANLSLLHVVFPSFLFLVLLFCCCCFVVVVVSISSPSHVIPFLFFLSCACLSLFFLIASSLCPSLSFFLFSSEGGEGRAELPQDPGEGAPRQYADADRQNQQTHSLTGSDFHSYIHSLDHGDETEVRQEIVEENTMR